MLNKETQCIKNGGGGGGGTFEYHMFPLNTALQKQHKICTCFPEDKIQFSIFPDHPIQKL